jgi:hypothetical protein
MLRGGRASGGQTVQRPPLVATPATIFTSLPSHLTLLHRLLSLLAVGHQIDIWAFIVANSYTADHTMIAGHTAIAQIRHVLLQSRPGETEFEVVHVERPGPNSYQRGHTHASKSVQYEFLAKFRPRGPNTDRIVKRL